MAASRILSSITVNPSTKHTATVIFLHGLGDSGYGWEPVAKMLARNPKLSHIKWILPNAPEQPVTLNFGMRMPSWFDIRSLDKDLTADDGGEDADGMLASAMSVNKIVTTQVDDENIPANRIVVGGFSQGAALSLLTGLTSERRLGGLVCLSGWLPLSGKMKSMMTDAARNLPIFFGHGTADSVVQFRFGKESYEMLQGKPFKFRDATDDDVKGLTWKAYPGMDHGSSPREIKDLEDWLLKVIPAVAEEEASSSSS